MPWSAPPAQQPHSTTGAPDTGSKPGRAGKQDAAGKQNPAHDRRNPPPVMRRRHSAYPRIRRDAPYAAVVPPSITSSEPVTKDDSSEAR